METVETLSTLRLQEGFESWNDLEEDDGLGEDFFDEDDSDGFFD